MTVQNTGGKHAGAETVLAFFRPENRTNTGGAELLPLQRRLCGFEKVTLSPASSTVVKISIRSVFK